MKQNHEEDRSEAINSLAAYQNAVNTAAIVSITDTEGRITFANDLFCEISKYKREELIGRNHRIINSGYHPAAFFQHLWHTIAAGNIWHGEIKNKASDGSCYWVDTTISPILNNDGSIARYLSIRRLITERKELEEERERLIGDLMHKNNELMQFNYIISHNLRAPIANLIGLSALLADSAEEYDEELKFLCKNISRSVASIDEIIRDLTQVLSARTPLNETIEEISISDTIKSVENNLETQIKESGTRFTIEIDEDAMRLNSIKSYLQSIFYNIISNAIKYGREGVAPAISIKVRRQNGWIVIKIADNGTGIDLDKFGTQIFGLYKKFDHKKEGRGLGLHMTKTQVESLGGRIEVESKPGAGTAFVITLPAAI